MILDLKLVLTWRQDIKQVHTAPDLQHTNKRSLTCLIPRRIKTNLSLICIQTFTSTTENRNFDLQRSLILADTGSALDKNSKL